MKDTPNTEVANTAKSSNHASNVLPHIVGALLLALLLICSGYMLGHSGATKSAKQQAELSTQIMLMQKKTKQQDDTNKGIVSASAIYKDPAGGLGLLEGKVTFTMPEGWERLPANRCSSYSRDSTVLCYDTAAIALKTQASDKKNPYWSANVSVFEYKKDDGTARQWFENQYRTQTLNDQGYPPARFIDEGPIAGNSGLIFQIVADSDYVNGFYVVVHGSYAVVVSAQLQYGAVYGTYPGALPYDYRSTFDPILKQFIKSVKFEDAQ